MIKVDPKPEPDEFDNLVRKPGLKFLQINPNPKSNEWKNYWTNILPEMCDAYGGICAYGSYWVSDPVVDHFIPKSKDKSQAYEWSNYRLASPRLNSRKGDYSIIDPFLITPGSFVLEFPSLLVKPNPSLSASEAQAVTETINRLKLNEDEFCLRYRMRWVLAFCTNPSPENIDFLWQLAPFIAYELDRQGIVDKIAFIMGL